jgi:hypothetical protein
MKWFILFLLTLQFSQVSFAAPATPETLLMKLSKSLKGESASLEDRQGLQTAVAAGRGDEFLKSKTQEYLNDAKFSLKLKQKVDELMRLIPQTAAQPVPTPENNNGGAGSRPTAYDLFVQNLIAQNLSWDHLLTGKNYRTFGGGNFLREEKSFYGLLSPNYAPVTDLEQVIRKTNESMDTEITQIDFPAQDQRVAGVLTTPRFFDRYVNTALNKNRRRAAAVFRIFMCDTMIPTVPAQDSKSQKTDYDTILPGHQNVTEQQIRKSVAGNIHGQQADCMSCHYKLDPLGQTFGMSAAALAPHASSGALRFQGYDGRKVDIALNGLGDLGEQVVKQPEYEKCQVSNFWRWYIGKDVPLSANRELELIKAFNQAGRKPKDFIAYLVNQPEFKEKPQILTEDQILSRRVVKIFKSCNSCHESTEEDVWDLTDLPYSRDARLRERKIKKLKEVLDTDGDGTRAEMPPEDSLWQLSQDDFATIKTWMERGSPDFKGTPQVTPGGSK